MLSAMRCSTAALLVFIRSHRSDPPERRASMSGDDARRDHHAADHEGEYDRAHCAVTARRDLRARHRRWDVRLCHTLPCSFGADVVRRWCGRGRRPLARLLTAMGWVGGDSGRGASGGVEKRPRRGFRAGGGVAGARCAIPIVGHSARAHSAITSSQDTSRLLSRAMPRASSPGAGREVAATIDCSSGQEALRGIGWHRRSDARVDNGDCAAERGVGRPAREGAG
eukprot:scaffold25422_cov80-Phaeocystis_antarctica.AAC.5